MLKAIILIGSPQKGTRFRPLSLEIPKPLFPIAGFPILHHLIESCAQLRELREILLVGCYQPNDALSRFIANAQQTFNISIRYLQEYASLGTGGGIYHFRDLIKSNISDKEAFFVINGDICADLPLVEMLQFHRENVGDKGFTILGTEATDKQSTYYGCMAWDKETHEVKHYVEKPSTFVSTTINCGVYLFTKLIFQILSETYRNNQQIYNESIPIFHESSPALTSYDSTFAWENIRLEKDVLSKLGGTGQLYVFPMGNRFWTSIKNPSSVIYANRHYLEIYRMYHPERLFKQQNESKGPTIIGDVFIHPTACVSPSAVLGPNVSVGQDVTIGYGVRVRESIILGNCVLQDHCCVLYSIIAWNSTIGPWSRVEGTPNDPDPNKQFSKIEQDSLFQDGKLHPSITVIGNNVTIPGEVVVLNAIVLPHKELGSSSKNQIIL
jgi:mannose-1-phosphate guanylyltransferase